MHRIYFPNIRYFAVANIRKNVKNIFKRRYSETVKNKTIFSVYIDGKYISKLPANSETSLSEIQNRTDQLLKEDKKIPGKYSTEIHHNPYNPRIVRDEYNFNHLSTEEVFKVALNMDSHTLRHVYYSNPIFNRCISDSEVFWTVKIVKDFKINTYEDIGRLGKMEYYFGLSNLKEEGLSMMALTGDTDSVKLLLNAGADIHENNDQALRYAIIRGSESIVKLLLEKGANPRVACYENETLINAVKLNHVNVVKLLLEKTMNILMNKHQYEEVLYEAKKHRDGKMAEMFKETT